MRYRKFGSLDWQVSTLAFGLNQIPGETACIDEVRSTEIIRYAIDRGVNFLDIGISGMSSKSVQRSFLENIGRALQDGYRSQVRCALTLPCRQIKSTGDCDFMVGQAMECFGGAGIEFLVLGDLDRWTWPRIHDLGILAWAEKAVVDGRAKWLGFSFHDDYQTLRTILDGYPDWTLCQIRYSLMDIDHHPGTGGLQLTGDHGLAIVVSEPLLNGRLVRNIPKTVTSLWTDIGGAWTAAEWGLRWVWNHPQVSTVAVNMKNMSHVMQTEVTAEKYSADHLSVTEQVQISRIRDEYLKLRPVPCTGCRGCMPCPIGIDVPRIFELWNEAVIYNDASIPRGQYYAEEHNIDNCTDCGLCAARCGLKIEIPEKLREARKILVG